MAKRGTPAAQDRAATLIGQAWDAIGKPKAAILARKALELDPDAIDAYVILGLVAETDIERIAILREAVRRGKLLWAEAIAEPEEFYFWLDIDTRPFMRAVHNLALLLWDEGERAEATDLARFLLDLNPNDNQGIRGLLLIWLPVLGDWDGVEHLLHRYEDDGGTDFRFALCLNAFRKGKAAQAEIAAALDANPFVPAFLADAGLAPSEDNPHAGFGVAMGSEHEAHDYADAAREAWQSVNGAIEWLGQFSEK